MNEVGKSSEFSATHDILTEAFIEAGFTTVEDLNHKEIERQKTIDELVEYFGGQNFEYKEYKGDIHLILSLCPEIKRMLDEGTMTVISFIEGYKVDELVEDKEDTKKSDDDSEKNSAELDSSSEDTKQPEKVIKKEPVVSKREEKVALKPELHPKSPTLTEATPAKAKVVVEKKTRDTKKPAHKKADKLEVKKTEKKTDTLKVDQPTQKQKIESNPIKPEPIKTVKDIEPIEKVEPIEVVESLKVAKPVELEKPQKAEALVDIEQQGETLFIKREAEPIPQKTLLERVMEEEIDEVAPNPIESWVELAQQEVSLDVLLTTMTKDLLKTENVVAQVENEKDMEYPEIEALLTAVSSARQTIDRLYQAKTQQECRECIDQLIIELAVILKSLGYENPEKIIHSFVYSQPTDSLRYLIEQLERALRNKLRQESTQTSGLYQPTHPRHIRLGKVASYIMKLLLPQEQLA